MAKTIGIYIDHDELICLDVDGALSADSDSKVPSQKAVKTYVDEHAGGAAPRLDQLLDPTADKTFELGAHGLLFDTSTGYIALGRNRTPGQNVLQVGPTSGNSESVRIESTDDMQALECALTVYVRDNGGSNSGSFKGLKIDAQATHGLADGILDTLNGLYVLTGISSYNGSGVITDAAAVFVETIFKSGVITNGYALRIADQTHATNNFAIKTGLGKVYLGDILELHGDLAHAGSQVGFFSTAPAARYTVTGSRGANAALASLLTALASYGLLVDGTS